MIIAHFIETLGRVFFVFFFFAWGRGGQERFEQGGRARKNSPPPKSENMQFCMLMCALPKMKAGVGRVHGAGGGSSSRARLHFPLTYSQVAIKSCSHFVCVTKCDEKQHREERVYFRLQFRGTVHHCGEVEAKTQ